ncbi:hypothetical protein [Burkholderia pseudomallei]|uniref:hypothetical protein n=1 Tax=Burkholderia pseudomallei TaxID=28450 RepID=UPI000811AC79|nr:hypothetical protein [Burkholderia pseudomallei]ANW49865.1 hypothetical protein A7U58_07175 [Burkholderia pseudomallei]ANW55882.1 hypothetical protein A7U59_07155 [Burkholderia pseudomallei]MCS6600758.1 hypothetical protein [Burkholderia pseudomallei]
MSGRNFLDFRFPVFSERVSEAAADGTLAKSGPLLNSLERTFVIVRGLEQIFTIARGNIVQEHIYRSSEGDGSVEPPLSSTSVEALLAMGAAVSQSLVKDIEDLSDWAEKYALPERRA